MRLARSLQGKPPQPSSARHPVTTLAEGNKYRTDRRAYGAAVTRGHPAPDVESENRIAWHIDGLSVRVRYNPPTHADPVIADMFGGIL